MQEQQTMVFEKKAVNFRFTVLYDITNMYHFKAATCEKLIRSTAMYYNLSFQLGLKGRFSGFLQRQRQSVPALRLTIRHDYSDGVRTGRQLVQSEANSHQVTISTTL